MSFVFESAGHGLQFDILEPFMRLILFGRFSFGKMWKNMENPSFFWAAATGLEKNCTGGYGCIGV